jgi:glycosyltransferase involved in cell wall biosynthesis
MSDAEAMVSIVIPTRDRRDLLAGALESLRAQTHPDWEALVCDDGSTDGTRDLVDRLAAEDERIRFLSPAGAPGACARRNQGAGAARGAFVIFLDSDDLLAAHCLAQRVRALRANPGLGFGVFPCRVFRASPDDTPLLWNADTGESDIDRYLRKDIPWQTASVIWRRDILSQVGPWDEAALSGQDWEFHLRALIRGVPYSRFSGYDCYWRMPEPERESIGNRAHDPEHHRHRAVMVERVFHWLVEAGQLTQRRRDLLVGQFFFVATSLTAKGARRDAMRVWTRCRRLGLIGPRRHAEGLAYLRFWHRKGFRTWMRARFERAWPAEAIVVRSKTQWNTPLPGPPGTPSASTGLAAGGRMGNTIGPAPEATPPAPVPAGSTAAG